MKAKLIEITYANDLVWYNDMAGAILPVKEETEVGYRINDTYWVDKEDAKVIEYCRPAHVHNMVPTMDLKYENSVVMSPLHLPAKILTQKFRCMDYGCTYEEWRNV